MFLHKIFWVLVEVHAESLDSTFSSQVNVVILVKAQQHAM